mmetsp:Transcript_50584/g.158036  ORF Transcript_50584/g.158036 Transcript_50584/m.158036 type:complete len:98 (+) Transcript_50584:1879-2172(+)
MMFDLLDLSMSERTTGRQGILLPISLARGMMRMASLLDASPHDIVCCLKTCKENAVSLKAEGVWKEKGRREGAGEEGREKEGHWGGEGEEGTKDTRR